MHTGTVKWYVPMKGLGFITDDDGTEVALMKSQILTPDRFTGEGQRVSFEVAEQNGRRAAVRVKVL